SETLRKWVRQAEIDDGQRPGVTSEEHRRIIELERENRELRRANEILKAAAAFLARELDPRLPTLWPSSTPTVTNSGSSRSAGCWRSPRPPTTPPSPGRPRPAEYATKAEGGDLARAQGELRRLRDREGLAAAETGGRPCRPGPGWPG